MRFQSALWLPAITLLHGFPFGGCERPPEQEPTEQPHAASQALVDHDDPTPQDNISDCIERCVDEGGERAQCGRKCRSVPFDPTAGARWRTPQADQCRGLGQRQYSAKLEAVGNGISPMLACKSTPIAINGASYPGSSRCQDKGLFGVWGEWDVPDQSCRGRWDGWEKQACSSPGKRLHTAHLADVPDGATWQQTCEDTAATIDGVTYPRPNRCVNELFGMWGHWVVPDATCERYCGDGICSNGESCKYCAQDCGQCPPPPVEHPPPCGGQGQNCCGFSCNHGLACVPGGGGPGRHGCQPATPECRANQQPGWWDFCRICAHERTDFDNQFGCSQDDARARVQSTGVNCRVTDGLCGR
jgi:hypothetical protein